ncbi:LpxA family transferase [Methylobacterium sp. J-090]|uniref:LpxA family transferase n=1 Tax=Methylobacterium sp. J-090 TaxID=2836666 RepID=UPI001FBC1150|nr:LpxA family transferase [Methylobacterium sp. J-090]MCJ2083785.1 LpxA family transferase [Methylobacterium sp. J-090]
MGILEAHVARFEGSPFASFASREAWGLVERLREIVHGLLDGLGSDFRIEDGIAVHRTATVEDGASLKAPVIVGPRCLVAQGSLIRGGCWVDEDCIVGPGSELKTTIVFRGSKLAHFNFVGDSLLGEDVNLEAGAIIANHRNEREEKSIVIQHGGRAIETGTTKFGALVGDGTRIGANAVVAPGAILAPRTIVERLALIDQRPPA